MTYRVKDRLNYIGTRQDQVRGEVVTYCRGMNCVPLSQCPGHTDVQDLIPENIVSVGRYVDFIFFTAQLIIPNVGLTLPQRGDLITWQGSTYTCTSPTATDEVFNFTTMYKDRIRVHTILTSGTGI